MSMLGHGTTIRMVAQIRNSVLALELQFGPMMVFVILQIRYAAAILKPWYACQVPDLSTIADIFFCLQCWKVRS